MSPRKDKLRSKKILRLARPMKMDTELQEASLALLYEIYMFHATIRSSIQDRTSKDPTYNALVESFILHTRNLIEFLYPTYTAQRDTIIAPDFLAEWRKDMPEWLHKAKTRANKLLAHLTYDRVIGSVGDGKWDCMRISNHIDEVLAEFFRRVPRDRIEDRLWNYWTGIGTHRKY